MLPLMVELIIACCDCLETTYFKYTNCSMTLSNLDNSGAKPIVAQTNTISKRAFGIRIAINRNENTCEVILNKSLFFQTAYATSCGCPPEVQYLPLDSIVSVVITTINDFNTQHPENTDVSKYFNVFHGNEFTGIDEYIGNIDNILYDFANPAYVFDLLLMSPPTIGIDHEFKVTVKLSDGRIFNTLTGLLELN